MTAPEASTFGGTSVPAEYQSQILVSAARWGIPPGILAAQISAESGFSPKAVSSAGAEGIAQFLPGTAKSLGVDPWNPASAIDGMARLDSINLKKFGNWSEALAAYNAGAGAVEQYDGVPPFAETQNYVKKILAAAGDAASVPGTPDVLTDNPLSDASQAVDGVENVVDYLSNPELYKRAGLFALGAGVVVVGIWFALPGHVGAAVSAVREIPGV